MGIPKLWDVIKEQDHSVPITRLAEDHFHQHGRPLRIAIDEADWRFNNLTVQQVYMIRETSNQPAYQGIEKSIFYRICRLLTLNLQLLFVFDGPSRPWKRGRRGGNKVDYEERRLLKELLDRFGIPHHEAPGEAEAECARLQQLGVVDAVFSQGSDTLMFGCSMLIRDDRIAKVEGSGNRSKENTRKSGTCVRVVYSRDIEERYNMNRQNLVLFAMLCGGDYDTSQGSRNIHVPYNFPELKTLVKYKQPKISMDDQLLNLAGLRNGWNAPVNELKLLELTSSRFNIWGKLYMKWMGPVLLTRHLVAKDPCSPKECEHQIKITKPRAKKGTVQSTILPSLTSLTFSPFGLTTLQRTDFEGERIGYWTSSAQDPFEPAFSVKTEIPTYLLQRALPSDMFFPVHTRTGIARKRKRSVEDGDVYGRTGPIDVTRGDSSTPSHADTRMPPAQPHENDGCAPSPATFISLISDSEEEKGPLRIGSRKKYLQSSSFVQEDLWAGSGVVCAGGSTRTMPTEAGIRAVRVRHFTSQKSTCKADSGTAPESSQAFVSPLRHRPVGCRLPIEEIETIDLT